MKIVKSTIIGALIGLTLGGLLSIGVVGSHSTCEGAKDCLSCVKLSVGGCGGCLSFWITPIKPFVYGTCGCFGFGCDEGCIDDWDCDIHNCISGLDDGCNECNKGCGDCGASKCDKGCTKCANGCDECPNDCERTQEALSNDSDAKKKIKNYLIYLTILGTVIGGVYGTVITIQEEREKKRRQREEKEAEEKRRQQEAAERRRQQEAEERRRQQEAEEKRRQQEAAERRRKQTAEEKWREMKNWLSE